MSEEDSRKLWRRAVSAPGRLSEVVAAYLIAVCGVASLWAIAIWLADLPIWVIYLSLPIFAAIIYCVGRIAALGYLRSVARRLRAVDDPSPHSGD